MSSIFTKIINGDLPAHRLWEDDHSLSFITLDAIKLGHSLVIPKTEVDFFADVPEPYYSAVFQHAKKLAPAIQKATECRRVGASIIGLEVPHFHLHLIPMQEIADLDFSKAQRYSDDEMAAMAAKIRSFL